MIDGKPLGSGEMERLINEGKIAQDTLPDRREPETERPQPRDNVQRRGQPEMNMPDVCYRFRHAIGQSPTEGRSAALPGTLAAARHGRRNLAAKILNDHAAGHKETRVLVRTVGTQVRGVLSDSFSV
jgi:hypothetical protein